MAEIADVKNGHSLSISGETVELLPQRAMWWNSVRTLILSDTHFGKGMAFRKQGQPIPRGSTSADLGRLSQLIRVMKPEKLVILGDFYHAKEGCVGSVADLIKTWRREHESLEIILIRGNHDVRAGDPEPELDIKTVDAPWQLGPFVCCHEPHNHREGFVLAGHLHPAARLYDVDGSSVKLPCFLKRSRMMVLPAFSSLAAAGVVKVREEDEVFVVAEGMVVPFAA